MSETGKALAQVSRRLAFILRSILCELLASLALKAAPDGYTPSFVEACVDAYKHRGHFADIKEEKKAAS